MSFEFTSIGYIVLAFSLIAFLRRGNYLLKLIVFLSVFQAAALFNIEVGNSYYGFGLIYLPMILFIIQESTYYRWRRAMITPYQPLLLYMMLAVLGAMLLPNIFAGIGVYLPRGGIGLAVDSVRPLQFSNSNLAQSAYIIINTLFLLSVVKRVCREPNTLQHLFRYSLYAYLLVLLLSCYQVVGGYFGLQWPAYWINNNYGYAQLAGAIIGGMPRVTSTFTEASVLGCYTLGICMGSLLLLRMDSTYRLKHAMLLITSLLILAGSFSGAAYFGLLLMILILFLSSCLRNDGRKLILLIMLFSIVLLALLIMLVLKPEFINAILLNKSDSISYLTRQQSNENALEVFLATFGVGVGIGSIRVSSFFYTLLASTGLLGVALVFWYATNLVRMRFAIGKIAIQSDLNYIRFFGIALLANLITMILAVPDSTLAFFWLNLAAFSGGLTYYYLKGRNSSDSSSETKL
jgi:hypothetical protein